jgi:hypothetical protein
MFVLRCLDAAKRKNARWLSFRNFLSNWRISLLQVAVPQLEDAGDHPRFVGFNHIG